MRLRTSGRGARNEGSKGAVVPSLSRPPSRIYREGIVDSTRWRAFAPRDGDILVNTPPKSGTTWTQTILALLISGDPDVVPDLSMQSPWIEIHFRPLEEVMARLEQQTRRRHVKSHTPFDGIPLWDGLRYIAVYRHPLDVHFSYRRHVANMHPDIHGQYYPEDGEECFRIFLEGEHEDAASLRSIVEHYRQSLALEPREDLLRLHYADMVRDLLAATARIAAHVGIEHPPDRMAALVEAARFDNMKANADRFAPSAGQGFWKDDAAFFDSGTSNKWEGWLDAAQLAAYDAHMDALLPDPAARVWLEWGAVGPTS
ncbi:MAG: sulfotransferase domain-containing protein [Pseudomonadota bacterium]